MITLFLSVELKHITCYNNSCENTRGFHKNPVKTLGILIMPLKIITLHFSGNSIVITIGITS